MQIPLDDNKDQKLEPGTEKQSQSLNVVSDNQGIDGATKSEFELRLDNYSSINCISEQPSKSPMHDQTKTKISYYVRDEF
jgi:LAS superfamily LD-carboxypeptidase LdcB